MKRCVLECILALLPAMAVAGCGSTSSEGDAQDDADVTEETGSDAGLDTDEDPDVETDPAPDPVPDAQDGAEAEELDVVADDVGPEAMVFVPLLSYVDPFIGTGGVYWGSANCFPGAVAPFGMVQASPDTYNPLGYLVVYNHGAGYHDGDNKIEAFSHTHMQGVSTPDMGTIGLLPMVGDPSDLAERATRRMRFNKADEAASPGYYKVRFAARPITAELTATTRGAVHRYTFAGSPDDAERVVVDLGHTLMETEIAAAEISVDLESATVEGWAAPRGRFSEDSPDLRTYFTARFSPAPFEAQLWSDESLISGTETTGTDIGAILTFDASVVEVHIALSYVDLDGARANFAAELEGVSFDEVWAATEAAWGEMLAPIRVHGGTPDQWKIFATALYHTFVMPGIYEDTDGRYVGMDGEVHTADDFTYHANFSMWDTYRTVHPLLSIIHPERQLDMVKTLLRMAEDGGHIPRWQMCSGYTNGTVGAPADIIFADSYMRGVTGFDVDQALELLVRDASNPPEPGHPFSGREQVESYVALGYVPADLAGRSVSWTQELAISDFAIAQLGEGRLDPAVVADFRLRGTNYANLWDSGQRVFRGRNQDGSWASPFNPWTYESGDMFYGGNAKQYAWLVPHDMPGLLALFPGPDVMRDDLLGMFIIAFENNAGPLDGLLPPTGYYHGNEPGLHMPYLFLVTGHPHLAQEWIDWVSRTYYTTNPNGISGNEDAGAMSAYYVWSSLGLYPVPATDLYLIGRPLFPYAEIDLPGGTLVIEAEGADTMFYVHDVTLDHETVPHPWIRHGQIEDGAVLRFTLAMDEGAWGTDFGMP